MTQQDSLTLEQSWFLGRFGKEEAEELGELAR
jgi:hypothetical protein